MIHILLAIVLLLSSACQTQEQRPSFLELGNRYARDGLFREALSAYQKALAETPQNPEISRNLGVLQVKLGNYKVAIEYLEKVIPLFDQQFEANFFLAEAYRSQERYAEAIYRYQRALSLHADHPEALKALAWSYFSIRYFQESLLLSQKLTQLFPEDFQAQVILARNLIKLRQFKEAYQVIKSGKSKASIHILPYFLSVEGDLMVELGKWDKAHQAYDEAVKRQPLMAGALLGLGRTSLTKNDPDQAIIYLERAIRVKPQLFECYRFLGEAYEKKDPKKALHYLRKFKSLAAKDPEQIAFLHELEAKLQVLQKDAILKK